MKSVSIFAFVLVLLNVVSPLVSASIKIPAKPEEKGLEEQLSNLFEVLEEDPLIDEISVVEVNSPEIQVDEGSPNVLVEEEEVCHPKDLSCSGTVTLLDTLTGDEVVEVVVGGVVENQEPLVVVVDDQPTQEIVQVISVERSLEEEPKVDEKRTGRTFKHFKSDKKEKKTKNDEESQDEKKPENDELEEKKNESETKPSLISLLKGKEQVVKETIKKHLQDTVVHLNKHEANIKEEILVPIKERSDDVFHSPEDVVPDVEKETSNGIFGSVFNMFG